MENEKIYYNDRGKLELDVTRDKDFNTILTVCDALASPVRLNIIKYLQNPPYIKTVPELVKELSIPKTTLIHHLNKLENAGVIRVRYKYFSHGTVRLINRKMLGVDVNLYYYPDAETPKTNTTVQSLGVGQYADFNGEGHYLKFATADRQYGANDCFFLPQRYDAQIVFSSGGRITYFFDNTISKKHTVTELSVSLEICSEAPFYNNDYMSDITFWINGKELTTYVSEGDYGDRRGFLNPSWWPDVNTQYGKLVNITVNEKGVFVNGNETPSRRRLKDLDLSEGNKIVLSFGNKDTAEHVGGFNVFGSGFGDYPQDICLNLKYELNN